MRIKGFLPTSLIDYPGKICSVIFLPGCNFRCPFCFNRELVLEPEKLPSIKLEDILFKLKKRTKWIDGVCITGGEPTLSESLEYIIRKIKDFRLKVKLDTNGSRPEVLKKLYKKNLLDYVAVDIKTSLSRYREATRANVNLSKINESARLLISSELSYEFRTTVVPSLFGEKEALEVGKWLKGAKCYFLQQLVIKNPLDPSFREKPYPEKKLLKLAELLKKFIEKVKIRGAVASF